MPLPIVRTWMLDIRASDTQHVPPVAYALRLEMAVQSGARWAPDVILGATRRAAAILSACGLQTLASLHEFDGPHRYRNLSSAASRELARELRLGTPTVFFVDNTLHQPAFDAEAIGRANSLTRPEMTNTVWITAATRDLPIALARAGACSYRLRRSL